jgi:hypothetical protein
VQALGREGTSKFDVGQNDLLPMRTALEAEPNVLPDRAAGAVAPHQESALSLGHSSLSTQDGTDWGETATLLKVQQLGTTLDGDVRLRERIGKDVLHRHLADQEHWRDRRVGQEVVRQLDRNTPCAYVQFRHWNRLGPFEQRIGDPEGPQAFQDARVNDHRARRPDRVASALDDAHARPVPTGHQGGRESHGTGPDDKHVHAIAQSTWVISHHVPAPAGST